MKYIKSFDLLIFIITFFCGFYFHIFGNLGFDLSKLPGDLGDTRLNNYFLEHGYLYLTGQVSSFWDAPFMFPLNNVIALSDNLLGTMPIYSVFRIFGINTETSLQSWFIVVSSLNFLCATFVFFKISKNLAIASIGAYIFAFNISMFGQYNHLQILPKFIIPFAFYFLILFFKDFKLKFFFYALLALVYQFYCGIYLGFLLSLCLFIFIIIYLFVKHREFILKIKKWKWTVTFLLMIIISLGLLIPLLFPYYKMSKLIGVWDLNSFFNSLPCIKSYFFIMHGSLIWHFLENTGANIPIYWEHYLFIGGIPIISLIFYIVFINRFPKESRIFLFTLFLLFLLTLRIGDFSLYKLIYKIPGFGSMRSLGRVIHVELFLYSFITVTSLSFVYFKTSHKTILTVLFLGTLLLDQYFNPKNVYSFNKYEAQNRKELVINYLKNNSVQNYSAFAICSTNKDQIIFFNIDAMMASQKILKPTVNGYSSTCFGPICDFLCKSDSASLNNWLSLNNFNSSKILIINP